MTSRDDHVVEHLGEWDHGIMDPAEQEEANRSNENTYSYDGVKRAILNAERACATSVKKVLHKIEQGIVEVLDEDAKGQVADHTEEEVAGMKLCVKPVVHKESFEAPC